MVLRILPKLNRELEDPRYFQILFLGSFLLYGILELSWDITWEKVVLILLSALVTQVLFALIYGKSLHSIKSALITALGLSLLLHVDQIWVGALAACLAISSKFLIRLKGKHIFNPANFGIILSIVLTSQSWVSPGQWGSNTILLFFIGSAGLMMILKVGRIDTAFAFIGTYALLRFAYVVLYLGWSTDVWIHQMLNGTLLLFTFFMITDPMTTPNHKKARWIWSLILAVVVFVASIHFYIQDAAVWALFGISLFTPLFDRIYQGSKFHWITEKEIKTSIS